jgi:hypothetical protein
MGMADRRIARCCVESSTLPASEAQSVLLTIHSADESRKYRALAQASSPTMGTI